MLHGKPAQEEHVGHGEHRGRETDPEGEGEDRDGGEAWSFPQGPQRVPHDGT